VDYQSTGRGEVEVTATEIKNHNGVVHDDNDDDDVITACCQLAVRMVEKKTGRIVSTGNLRFVKASSSSSSTTTNTPRADNNNNNNHDNNDIIRDDNGGPVLSRM
jgi:ABC-type sulfate transport system substrate-binding protein